MSWAKVGTLRKSKLNGGFYIKVDNDVTLTKDSTLSVQDPRKKLQESVAAGRLSAEKAEEMAAKIPEYIRYEIYVTPPNNKG